MWVIWNIEIPSFSMVLNIILLIWLSWLEKIYHETSVYGKCTAPKSPHACKTTNIQGWISPLRGWFKYHTDVSKNRKTNMTAISYVCWNPTGRVINKNGRITGDIPILVAEVLARQLSMQSNRIIQEWSTKATLW